LYYFEPHQPELCGFVPNVFVDITPVFEKKVAAMQVMASQQYLQHYYAELAERRANHARRISGAKDVRYAEAFQRVTPLVVRALLGHG
jgi:4-oxalomesaconate hydratase